MKYCHTQQDLTLLNQQQEKCSAHYIIAAAKIITENIHSEKREQ
jgi:hypothetical protein